MFKNKFGLLVKAGHRSPVSRSGSSSRRSAGGRLGSTPVAGTSSQTTRPGRGSNSSRFNGPSSGRSSYNSSRPASGSSSRFSRGGSRGGFRSGGRGKSRGERIDISKFVCKAGPVENEATYVPKNSFADFIIEEQIKKNLAIKGYVNPMPIQDQSIQHILDGRDVVGIANTGTGKTAAFAIPLLDKVAKDRTQNVMVVVPTRELAQQINQELITFGFGLKIFSVCCVGGAPIFRQINDLRRSHNFVIGTPGRLKDLIDRRCIDPSRFKTIVLDEADRMLDMGFIADMRHLMSQMPKDRQTLFFSATLSSDIQKIINDFLTNPVTISVKTRDTAKSVDQDVIRTKGEPRINVLHNLLSQPGFEKVLIFGRTKYGVEELSVSLSKRGFKAESIHGDKNQGQRQRALRSFKEDQINILVATDVAARGLDIPDVTHVINYELPATYDDYVHRIGRTGRGNKQGKALTFVD